MSERREKLRRGVGECGSVREDGRGQVICPMMSRYVAGEMAGRPTISYIWWAVILVKNSSSESSSIDFEDVVDIEVTTLELVLPLPISDSELLPGVVPTAGIF